MSSSVDVAGAAAGAVLAGFEAFVLVLERFTATGGFGGVADGARVARATGPPTTAEDFAGVRLRLFGGAASLGTGDGA